MGERDEMLAHFFIKVAIKRKSFAVLSSAQKCLHQVWGNNLSFGNLKLIVTWARLKRSKVCQVQSDVALEWLKKILLSSDIGKNKSGTGVIWVYTIRLKQMKTYC